MKRTKITWAQGTCNPVKGCGWASSGCDNCYARLMALRLKGIGTPGYENGFEVSLHIDALDAFVKRRKPTLNFINSMSDSFHPDVTFSFLDEMFDRLNSYSQHTFIILTKRAERMAHYFSTRNVPDNVWLGVTVENREAGYPRIEYLRHINASVKFISAEPLLEDLYDINLTGINWLIAGGESGNRARPMKTDWARRLRDICASQHIPYHFKQHGTWGPDGVKRSARRNGNILDGCTHLEFPEGYDVK